MLKKCYKCGNIKNTVFFGKNKSKKDKLTDECKSCKALADAEYRKNNALKIKNKYKEYYNDNKKQMLNNNKIWRDNNKDKVKALNKKHYNLDKQERNKKWQTENKEHLQEYYKKYNLINSEKIKNYKLNWERDQRQNNVQFKIKKNLRERIRSVIIGNKVGSAVRDLGCSVEELKDHLESKFYSHIKTKEMMSWDNYGSGWHIDHIKPLASFDLANREQFLEACHYTNLQPLWAEDNLKKGCKIIE